MNDVAISRRYVLHLEDEPQWSRRLQLVLGDTYELIAAQDLEAAAIALIRMRQRESLFGLFIMDANIQLFPESDKLPLIERDTDLDQLRFYGLATIVGSTSTESDPNTFGITYLNMLDPHLARLGYETPVPVVILSGNAADYHHMVGRSGQLFTIVGVFDKGNFVEQADEFLSLARQWLG